MVLKMSLDCLHILQPVTIIIIVRLPEQLGEGQNY